MDLIRDDLPAYVVEDYIEVINAEAERAARTERANKAQGKRR